MAERKTLTITQVNEIQKVGDKQIPKLSFKAYDIATGEARELSYFTFKSSLFDAIKEGQTITADVEVTEQGEYTNRKIVQIYKDGQPVSGKGSGRAYGKSPEELEQQKRLMLLAYSKDMVVAGKVELDKLLSTADWMLTWVNMTDKVTVPIIESTESRTPTEKPASKPSAFIDMDWLKESLEKINWADVGKWLKDKYPEAKGTTIKTTVESLAREHQEEFVKEVQTRLEIQENTP